MIVVAVFKKKSLPSPHSWIYYIFGKKHIIVLSPFKKKNHTDTELLKWALSYIIYLAFF